MEWSTTQHFILIILCFLVALIPRYIPLFFFRERKIPVWFNEWMKYVPVALFTSLVVKSVFLSSKYQFVISGKAPELLAAVLVIAIAYWTRSMAISVIIGLIAVYALTFVI